MKKKQVLAYNFNFLSNFIKFKIGSIFSKQTPPTRVLILGLDNSGKTTILKNLQGQKDLQNQEITQGFNCSTIKIYGSRITAFDVGGQQKLRQSWQNYFQDTQALVFVIDASDSSRMQEVETELFQLINYPQLNNIPILILANKQDLNAMTGSQIIEELKLYTIRDHPYQIQECCALTGEGLEPGFKWLLSRVN